MKVTKNKLKMIKILKKTMKPCMKKTKKMLVFVKIGNTTTKVMLKFL